MYAREDAAQGKVCLLLSLSLFCTRFLQERVIHLSLFFSTNSSIFPPFISSSLCSLGQWRRMRSEWRRKNKKARGTIDPSAQRAACAATASWLSLADTAPPIPPSSLSFSRSHSPVQSRSPLLIQHPPAITLCYHFALLSRVALFFTQ